MPTIRSPQNLDRISIVSASILLAYTFTGFISIPAREFAAQLPGFYFEITINTQTIVSLLVIGLTISGTDWLLRSHPASPNQPLGQHFIIPALTAWVIYAQKLTSKLTIDTVPREMQRQR